MTELKTISPQDAAELVRKGAVLIDIRDEDEHARERIPGARHHALSRIDAETLLQPGDGILVFHCRSGARTSHNVSRLAGAAESCEAYILDGGLDAWKKAGLPISLDRAQPIELMRQVQIAAGSLAAWNSAWRSRQSSILRRLRVRRRRARICWREWILRYGAPSGSHAVE